MSGLQGESKRGWRLAGATSALLLASLIGAVGSAPANQPFFGHWHTSYNGGTLTGFVNFNHVPPEQGLQELNNLGGTPCQAPTDYFTGDYYTGEPDYGFVAGCTLGPSCTNMVGAFRSSAQQSLSGTFTIFIQQTSGGWSGDYSVSGGGGGTWSGYPAGPPPGPGNSGDLCGGTFFGKQTNNTKAGTATVDTNVPDPGTVDSGTAVSAYSAIPIQATPERSRGAAASTSKSVSGPAKVRWLIKAKGKAKRKLKRTGKVKVAVKFTFTPTGGTPSSEIKVVKLIKKH